MPLNKSTIEDSITWLSKYHPDGIALSQTFKSNIDSWLVIKDLSDSKQLRLINFISLSNGLLGTIQLLKDENYLCDKALRVLKDIELFCKDQNIDLSTMSKDSQHIINGESPSE